MQIIDIITGVVVLTALVMCGIAFELDEIIKDLIKRGKHE